MRKLRLLVGSALALVMFSALSHAQGVGPHVGVGHLAGSAAGLDDGYTSFGGFVPLWQSDAESLWFLDGAFQQYNEGSGFIGGNVGVGNRQYSSLTDSLLGGYVYYDRRELDDFGFDQVGGRDRIARPQVGFTSERECPRR